MADQSSRARARAAKCDARWAELRAGGMNAAEAWARAKLEIAEAGAAEVEMDLDELELLPAGTWPKPATDPQVTMEWVAEHLDQEVLPADAPSGTAWGLLAWARAEPAGFWSLWGRVVAVRGPIERT